MKGKLLTFEAGEGAGKSTHIALLNKALEEHGFSTVQIREPGGTTLGERIRYTLKHDDTVTICSEAELLLFNASRAQLVNDVINPALEEGKIVLCDRFYDSSMAYQGYARGIGAEKTKQIINFATRGLRPDLTFFIDCPFEKGLENVTKATNRKQYDRLDLEKKEFHENVIKGFKTIIENEPERFLVVPYIDNGIERMQKVMKQELYDRFGMYLK